KRFYQITLRGELPERNTLDFFGRVQGRSFLDLQRQLTAMRDDPTVGGVVLDITGLSMGFGQLWELRGSIATLRDQGIPVVAYMHTTTYRDYYLASVADKVFMGPSGTFNARGLSSQRLYYREALDRLNVQPDFLRIGDYKSAPESYTRTGPTPAADEALNSFLDDVWEVQIGQIAQDRGLEPQDVDTLIDKAPHLPNAAIQAKLIDQVLFPDELNKVLRDLYGPVARVSKSYGRRERDYDWGRPPQIAILYVDGTIVRGKSGSNPLLGDMLVGDETIAAAAKKVLKDPNILGAVIRIDSPGGSATGSDLMYRALKELAEKKPVIVSMGDIAASGGYYAAAAGNAIYCNPTTLTGSIGIFSGKFALRGLFGLVGLNRVTVKRGDQADLYNLDDPWTPDQRAIIQKQIDYLYDRFLAIVSEGRSVDKERANALGQGRIWSGTRAKTEGLCDTHGGLMDAVERVRQEAGLDRGDRAQIISLPSGNILSPISIPNVAGADLSGSPLMPDLPTDLSDAELFEAYAPLRTVLQPLRPALDLALTFEDGEPLAMMPFILQWP
ncbi:MAG: signal peptide peptidase SppA, partial [Myxococcota bacterium]